MKYTKSIIILMLAIFIFSVAGVYAGDVNETLEISSDSDIDLSDSAGDVSTQIEVSGDENANGSSQIMAKSYSQNAVSDYEDTDIGAEDSDEGNDVLSASPNMVITNTVLNPVVNKGDFVDFNIFVRNEGDAPFQGINPLGDGWHVGVSLVFDSNQLKYDHFTPGINPDTLQTHASTYREVIRNGNNELWFGYDCEGGFLPQQCINFTVTFKVLSYGTLETGASIMWGGTESRSRTLSRDSKLVITNTAVYPNVNRDGEASFEVSVINNGGTYKGISSDGGLTYCVGIEFSYDVNQLEYAGCSYDAPSRYLEVKNNTQDSNVQFAYNTSGAFRYGESFKFTVIFKVKSTGNLTTSASIMEYNAQASAASVNAVNTPQFVITNVASLPVSNTGDDVAFEVSVVNNGDTFYPEYIDGERFVGVNFLYDSVGLTYKTFTASDNPSMYLAPKVNPDSNTNLVQFAHKVGDSGFCNGDNFKFKAIFTVNRHGNFETTAQIMQFAGVTSNASTVSMDANIQITNIALTPFTDIGYDEVFEISGKNVGGTFRDSVLGIALDFNDTYLDYLGFSPNKDSEKYDLGYNPNPSFDLNKNGLLFGYDTTQKFYYGDTFNFTVTFKVLLHGTFETTAFWWQGPTTSRSTAEVVSSDTNFVMSVSPNSLTMKVGDNVYFTYAVRNMGARYDGTYIAFDVYFDADKLEYRGLTPIVNLNLESIEYISYHSAENASGFGQGADSSVGHLKLGYASEDGFDAGTSFNFDVHFNVLTDGKLQTAAKLESGPYNAVAEGYSFAGDPSFNLTMTADNYTVNEGEEVSFYVLLENNGTLQYTENQMVIYIHDWYPEGLQYLGYVINPNDDGVKPIIDVENSSGHVKFKYDLIKNGLVEGWAPGSALNVTLRFKVKSEGIISNWVWSEWNASDVCCVASGNLEGNLTERCLNSTADVGDLIYYEIYLENTGNITYSNPFNGGVDYLIIEDLYPVGLAYFGYISNLDKNGNIWENSNDYIGQDGDGRVIIKYKLGNQGWAPGESLNATLIFKATNVGVFTNTVKFNYILDDSGEIAVNQMDQAKIIVGPPAFAVEMNSSRDADVGDMASFSIVYSNTGNRTITGAYIKDNSYSKGLKYYDYSDKALWEFDGVDTWHYRGNLQPGESAVLELKFNTTSPGFKTNTAVAGHNITGDTVNATANITVSKIRTNLAADAVTTTYNINKDLVITLKDADGNPIGGVKVSVDLNGAKKYTTDKNGQVKVPTKGLAAKTYSARIGFNGNVNYDASAKDVKVTVKKATPKMTAKKKTFKNSKKVKKYTITLKDNTGKPIKKAKVTLKVKGKTYKAKTNSKGKATFKIKNLKKNGKYRAVIKYKGDKNYKKLTKKVKLTVKAKKSAFKTQSKGSKDKATVKKIQQALKNNGYYLSFDGHYLKIDGVYHGCTERSVKEFQHDKGLKVTGKVDEKTAKKLGII